MIVPFALAETLAREAFSEPYRQTPPFNTRHLELWLKERGIILRWESIHHLWSVGVLRPIAVDDAAINQTQALGGSDRFAEVDLGKAGTVYVDLGLEVTHDSISPSPAKFPGELRESLWWHPFQLWQFVHLARLLKVSIGPDAILSGADSYAELSKRAASWALDGLVRFTEDDVQQAFQSVLALLLIADPVLHSQIQGSHTWDLHGGESPDGYMRWIRSQEGQPVWLKHKLTVDEVRAWHERMSYLGRSHDPFGPYREYIRRSDPKERARLRGEALIGQELYDSAMLLRLYLICFHRIEVPDEIEISSLGPRNEDWRQRLRRFGLDPQERVHWFIEGDTEEGYVGAWAALHNIGLREAGVVVRNVKGTGNFNPAHLLADLEYCRREKIYAYVSTDEDLGAPRQLPNSLGKTPVADHIRELKKYDCDGLLPAGFTCWEEDFVTANFSLDEVAAIATNLARDNGFERLITADDIYRERNFKPDGAKRAHPLQMEKAVASLLRSTDWGKGQAWGKKLAEWAVDHPRLAEGKTEMIFINDDERPISKLITMLIRAHDTDYDLSVEEHAKHLDCP